MAYKFFDKRYLLFPDDEGHIGDKVFYTDDWNRLITEVESGNIGRADTLLSVNADLSHPFETCTARWRFAYCDPAYEARVAYSQGKIIEYRRKDDTGDGMWHISAVGVVDPECCDYRVKPDETEYILKARRMTNKELARWLAEGKGQKMEGSNKHRYCTYAYNNDDDLPCRDSVKIRAWNEEYWHEPLVEV